MKYKRLLPIFIISSFALIMPCCEDKYEDVLPMLNTLETSDADITSTTATLKGEVTDLGNMRILEYGIEISKSQIFSPSTKGKIDGAPDLGTYEIQFTGLTPNTKYYYKAYVLINTAEHYADGYLNFTTKP
jgi:hypothetical protein